MRRAGRIASWCLGALLAPIVAQAEIDPIATARSAIADLAAAADQLSAAQSARDRVAALTATITAHEEGLLALRESLRRAALREEAITLRFEAERGTLSDLLSALQNVSAEPAPVLLLHPDGPLPTIRAGLLLGDATPALAQQALALRAELEEMRALQELQNGALVQIEQALSNLQTARGDLAQAIAERREPPPRFDLDDEALRQIVSTIDTLDGLIAFIGPQSLPATAQEAGLGRFEDAKGNLAPPVAGRVLRGFNQPDAAGIARPGLILAVRPVSLVTAPWHGTIRYAGPLLDYDNVILIETGGDYLLILAGLGDLYVTAGQVISTGDPLGLALGAGVNSEELIATGADRAGGDLSETIYMELRNNDEALDPAPWFLLQ